MSTVVDPIADRPTDRRSVLLVVSGLMLVMLLASLDQTIVSTALPTIVGELGGLEHLSWVVTAYLLAVTIVTPLYGKLGDLYGRKIVLQGALVIFLVGSVLCGLAQGMTELIAFRAIQGLGGGGLMVSAQAAIGDVVPPRERGKWTGLFGAVFGISSIAGPLIGGFLTTNASWRWIFYVNVPLGLVALGVLAVTLPGKRERVEHSIDYVGTALLAAALSALVLATTLGGTSYDWNSPFIIAMGVIAVVGIAAFVVAERRAKEPILPPSLFRNRVFTVTSAVGLVVGLRPVRRPDVPAALPAGRPRRQPDRVRAAAHPGHGRVAVHLDPRRAGHHAHRPLPLVPDRRDRDRRRRAPAARPARPTRRARRSPRSTC